jgi:hypothetical protein
LWNFNIGILTRSQLYRDRLGLSIQQQPEVEGKPDPQREDFVSIAGSDRGDIVREILDIVGEVAHGLPDPLDDDLPGG